MSNPAVHHVNQRHWHHRWRATQHGYRECIGCGMRSHWDGAHDPCARRPSDHEFKAASGTVRLDAALARARARYTREGRLRVEVARKPDLTRTVRTCKWGHLVDGDNVYTDGKRRRCRACKRRYAEDARVAKLTPGVSRR